MVENLEIDLTSPFSKSSTVLGTQQTLSIYLLHEQNKLISSGEALYASHWKEALPLRHHILESVCNLKVGHMYTQRIKVFTNSNKMSVGRTFWDGDLYAETVLRGSSQNQYIHGSERSKTREKEKLGWDAVVTEVLANPSGIWACSLELSWIRTSVSALHATTSYQMWAAFRKESWLWTRQLSLAKGNSQQSNAPSKWMNDCLCSSDLVSRMVHHWANYPTNPNAEKKYYIIILIICIVIGGNYFI